MSDWNNNIVQIRDSILALKAELERGPEPRDRLDCVSKIIQCIEFMKQSNIGWLSLLANPTLANRLDDESLKDIFSRFKKMGIARIENDVDCINRYMIDLVPKGQ